MVGDICDPEVGKRAVKTAVDTYGRLDIVLANQFSIMGGAMGSMSSRLLLEHQIDANIVGQGLETRILQLGGTRRRLMCEAP